MATIRAGDFEWDSAKAAANVRKHGVSFAEAISVFLDPPREEPMKPSEPSKASLREMPEIDFTRARVVSRGRHAARARRSFETLIIDKKTLKALGGADAALAILEAVANSIAASRKKGRAA